MVIDKDNDGYIQWSPILAGAVLACAISTVLMQFGAAVGFTQIINELSIDQNITPGKVLGVGIWVLWVQVFASLGGGYIAGRMRTPVLNASEHERDMRDGMHGLLVWASATLMVVVAAFLAGSVAALADNPTEDIARAADIAAIEEKATVIFAFCAGATSLVAAVISWWAATVGGDHRDTGTDYTRYFTFRVLK